MQQKYIFQGIKGHKEIKLLGLGMINTNPEVEFRLTAIKFYNEFGIEATKKAYGISRSTIYSWARKYRLARYDDDSLIPKSTRPKHTPRRKVSTLYVNEIKRLRYDHKSIGKDKLKVFTDKFAKEKGLSPISVSTIGRIIKRCNLQIKMKLKPYNKYKYKVKNAPKNKPPGYVEIDSIQVYENGCKTYILNAIDISTRLMYSFVYPKLSSTIARDFAGKVTKLFPFKINTIQTDNGSEFQKHFHKYLLGEKIKHEYIYPRSPKINGIVERANRTIREDFINEYYFMFGVKLNEEINQELARYLIWYNNLRPHRSIKNMTPSEFYIKSTIKSNMLWTHTAIF